MGLKSRSATREATLFFLVMCLASATSSPAEPAPSRGTRFVVFGHTYGLLKTAEQRQRLIDHVNAEGVDYVFALGDADLWNPAVTEQYRKGFSAPLHSAPGNHDLTPDRRQGYQESVGYLEKTLTSEDANFILVNSSEDVTNILGFLERSMSGLDASRVTVLLGHHRIWDDNLLSDRPYQHDKSYEFAELLPRLKGNVDHIFAGNSPAQYFTNPKNPHIVYWSDVVWGIPCYSVGVAWTKTLTYLVVQVQGSELMIAPRSIPPVSRPKTPPTTEPHRRDTLTYRVLVALQSKKFLAGLISGILLFGFAAALRRRLARNSEGRP